MHVSCCTFVLLLKRSLFYPETCTPVKGIPWSTALSWVLKNAEERSASRARPERDTNLHNLRPSIRRDKGSRLVGGTRLVVFPRPNRSQFEKATSRDPLSSRDPLPLAPSQRGAGWGVPARSGGPGSKGGRGPGSWCSSACTGSRIVGIPWAESPQRAGTPRIFPIKGEDRVVFQDALGRSLLGCLMSFWNTFKRDTRLKDEMVCRWYQFWEYISVATHAVMPHAILNDATEERFGERQFRDIVLFFLHAREKSYCETISAAQLPHNGPQRRLVLKERLHSALLGGEATWRHFIDKFGKP